MILLLGVCLYVQFHSDNYDNTVNKKTMLMTTLVVTTAMMKTLLTTHIQHL